MEKGVSIKQAQSIPKSVNHCASTILLAGLDAISHLPLEELNISHCGADDSHMAVIGKMVNLKKLNISHNVYISSKTRKLQIKTLVQCSSSSYSSILA